MESIAKRLLESLRRIDLSKFIVTSLPDFFIDIILSFEDLNDLLKEVNRIYRQGGGNIPIKRITISSGGNASNVALALSKLGVKSYLIFKTNRLGEKAARFFLEEGRVNVDRMKIDEEISITISFEIDGRNIMFSYPGSVRCFSFEDLEKDDLDLISSSNLLYVGNWNLNKKGTDLSKKVFNFAKRSGVKTYLDIGDPSTKVAEIDQLIEMLSTGIVDIISLNENELKFLASKIGITEKGIVGIATEMQKIIKARIDVHTKEFSFSNGKIVETFKIKPKAVTGAGDAWNAGNILGELLKLEDRERLLLANAVAALYLTNFPSRPCLQDVERFLSNKLGK